MNKKEFKQAKEALCIIVSFDPVSGKSIYDYYNASERDQWMEQFEKDFPDLFHFSTINNAALNERRIIKIKDKENGN